MDWTNIKKEYENSTITLKALAEKHGIKLGTMKSRKSREKWSRDPTKKDATKKQKVATLTKKDATPKKETTPQSLPSDELTDKQRLFCMYYIKTFNATQSAIKAKYAPDSAHVTGSQLLRNPKVGEYIRELKGHMTDSLFIDAMDVLQKYAAIAFADITEYTVFGKKEVEVMAMFGPVKDDDGNPLVKEVNYVDFKESNAIDGTIVTEVKQGKDGVSIKLADKMRALDKLWEYFDLLPDSYKRKLQEEKIKADIDKTKAEVDKITTGKNDEPIEIVIKRKGDGS